MVPGAAVVAVPLLLLPQAAMTLPMTAALMPSMLPRVTKVRREMLPFANESMRLWPSASAEERAASNCE